VPITLTTIITAAASTTTISTTTISSTTTTTTITTTLLNEEDEEVVENEAVLDEQDVSGPCSGAAKSGSDCDAQEQEGPDVVLIAGVTVGVLLCLAVAAAAVSLWLCRKSQNRKHVYATMDEDQPRNRFYESQFRPKTFRTNF
jgi:hypothetical protein